MIIKWIKRLNEALLSLILGILLYGILVELIGVWFVTDKLRYTTGLAIGIACAVGIAIHLAMIIEESVRIGEGHDKILGLKSALRYVVVCVIFFAMMLFKLGNLYTALIGLLGLKVSAYAQPLLNKALFERKSDKGELVIQEEQKNS